MVCQYKTFVSDKKHFIFWRKPVLTDFMWLSYFKLPTMFALPLWWLENVYKVNDFSQHSAHMFYYRVQSHWGGTTKSQSACQPNVGVCVRVCVRACVRACVCVWVCVCLCILYLCLVFCPCWAWYTLLLIVLLWDFQFRYGSFSCTNSFHDLAEMWLKGFNDRSKGTL